MKPQHLSTKGLRILTFCDAYLPGYKAGGPIRTLANLVGHLGNEFTFLLITRDRDHQELRPYPDIAINEWQPVNNACVYYASPCSLSFWKQIVLIRSVKPHLLYCNSFFSFSLSIKPLLLRWLHLIPHLPVILAPRGEFSDGALKLKKIKKQLFIGLAKFIGLYKDVVWQASSIYEKKQVQSVFGDKVPIIIAPNLSPPVRLEGAQNPSRKMPNLLRIVFLARISRIKNLDGALHMLQESSANMHFHIYGVTDDLAYWKECQALIAMLPSNIRVTYHGAIAHQEIREVFRTADLLFLPTFGENFGHSILEAMSAGRPVLISDQTPWKNLTEQHAGWDISLSRPERFKEILTDCYNMSRDEHQVWCDGAWTYALNFAQNARLVEQNRHLFCETAKNVELGKRPL